MEKKLYEMGVGSRENYDLACSEHDRNCDGIINFSVTAMKKLKVLKKGISPYQNFKFVQGKEYTCTDFDDNPRHLCSAGFYATDVEGLPFAWRNLPGYEIWECEVGGKAIINNIYKQRFEKIVVKRLIEKEEVVEMARKEESRLGYLLSEILYPLNPLEIPKTKITDIDIENLGKWDSTWDEVWGSVGDSVWGQTWDEVWGSVGHLARASVWDSVWDSVGDSVRASVEVSVRDLVEVSVGHLARASVWDSVWDSVGDSVRDSVGNQTWAYISSFFPRLGQNPFQPGIDLWKRGIIASCNGKAWRLHGGEKAEILYQKERS